MNRDRIPGRYAMQWIVDDAIKDAPKGCAWVEVGVALGKGLTYMAQRLIEEGRDDIRLYAVDPWEGYARNGEQQATGAETLHGDWSLFLDQMLMNAPEVLRRIHIIRAPSVVAASIFPTFAQQVQLCIIDANHSYIAVRADIDAWLPTVMVGGWIGGDDHVDDFPGVAQACRETWGEDYEAEAREGSWMTWRKRVT